MSCFSCGAGLAKGDKSLAEYYYSRYIKFGEERYFYKLNASDSVKFIQRRNFLTIFVDTIEPNLVNGAEYAHIKELKT